MDFKSKKTSSFVYRFNLKYCIIKNKNHAQFIIKS
jgi:hypothetical protein